MFLTVTLNPALDKSLYVDRNAPQETLRARRAVDLAGGKGINVARALLGLGESRVRALFPTGGYPGAHVAALARAEGMEVWDVPVSGQSRTALTVFDAETDQYWHYLEPGPELSPDEQRALQDAFIQALDGCHTVAICGSLPSPAAAPLVPWLVQTARERGRRVLLDSFGPALLPALEAGPWLAKPNDAELAATLGEPLGTEAERWAALERLASWGVAVAVLSLGGEGALALADGARYRLLPAPVTEVNDLGGGDSMVAGLGWAAASGYNMRDCLAWGAACGAANAAVWDPGGIRRADVERLLPLVTVL